MSTELRKKIIMFVHFCMNCMRNYVQQDANCIAAPVREKKKKNTLFWFPFSKAPKALSYFYAF